MQDGPKQVNHYDEVPYLAKPYAFAHPRRLEVMATLFGMKPPPLPSCRVLELGCAGGANLIPQAQELPGSRFVGVDLSRREIDEGVEMVRALGLQNIELREANIMDIDDGWGQFDYIICHGILSWVPPEVQEKMLQVCKRNLTADGVAMVSYNTLPGWHTAGVAADMMRYHASQIEDPAKRVEEAKTVLTFMAENSDENTAIGAAYREELTAVQQVNNDVFLFHDHLEGHNEAFYLSKFVKRASDHGLQYLADTALRSMLPTNYPEHVQEVIRSLSSDALSLVEQEQYLDFLTGRRFRTTLLSHQEIPLERRLTPQSVVPLQLALAEHSDKLEMEEPDEQVTVFHLAGDRLTVTDPVIKAAMLHLKEIYPEYISYPQLRTVATATSGSADPELLAHGLVAALCVGMIDACVHSPPCTSKPGQRPLASPLARLQAERGLPVTTQRHEMMNLDDLGRHVVRRLDGTHDRRALIGNMKRAIDAGEIVVKTKQRTIEGGDVRTISLCVDSALTQLSQVGFLIS